MLVTVLWCWKLLEYLFSHMGIFRAGTLEYAKLDDGLLCLWELGLHSLFAHRTLHPQKSKQVSFCKWMTGLNCSISLSLLETELVFYFPGWQGSQNRVTAIAAASFSFWWYLVVPVVVCSLQEVWFTFCELSRKFHEHRCFCYEAGGYLPS